MLESDIIMERQPDIWTQVNQVKDQPASIELHRGAKGGYDWTIKLYAEDLLTAEELINETNGRLSILYGGGGNEKQTA